MKLVNKNSMFPLLWDSLFTENRLDVNNYETFNIPLVNIKENTSNFVLEVLVPGFKKEDIIIEVEENVLNLTSREAKEVESIENSNENTYRKQEFTLQPIKRSFKLSESINQELIKAKFENGILFIDLPKKEEVKVHKKMVEIS